MGEQFEIINNLKISAIYFGMLRSGYEYFSAGKETETVSRLESYRASTVSDDTHFFKEARQNTCEVYPFWPRAAALETATFFIDPERECFTDFNSYYRDIMASQNLLNIERNQAFWDWVKAFPKAISDVMRCPDFRDYVQWENGWINGQNEMHQEALAQCEKAISYLVRQYTLPLKKISAVLCPIKCCYSADYHIDNDTFYAIAGIFNMETIVHEFLHPVIHPFMIRHKDSILSLPSLTGLGIDDSYYMEQDDHGKLNAFEEYVVRSVSTDITKGQYEINLDDYLTSLLKSL